MKIITVIGTGYVGLATGAALADMGNCVTCLDIDENKVKSLQSGEIPFFEPGLKEIVGRGIKNDRLRFSNSYKEAVRGAEICFLALPTPSNDDESCNLSYILSGAKSLAGAMTSELIIVNKSTVPVGTAKQVANVIRKALEEDGKEVPFHVVSNPEFLREGSAVQDFMNPERIILGVDSKWAEKVMLELYLPFHDKILVMDIPSSELAKYAANTMLAMRLSLMNDLSQLSEKLGADIESIRKAIGSDKRIGSHYLRAGIGFGGSCLPKDVRALRSMARDADHDPSLYDAILNINAHQQSFFLGKIEDHYGNLEGKTLAIWGLSFKPDTDDVREAPSLSLCKKLLEKGAHLKLYDPVAIEKARPFFNTNDAATFCEDEYEAATHADGIVLVTEWKPFQMANFKEIGVTMKEKVFFDGRNQHTQAEMESFGFDYYSIGCKSPKQEIAIR